MSYRQTTKWGLVMIFVMSLISGCGGASPTPILIDEPPASTPLPQPLPRVVVQQPTAIQTAANTGPYAANPTPTIAGTVVASPTLPAPIERPFLMKIDRISVIPGRGTLLEGRVVNGTLQAGREVEILSPQNNVISATVLAILVFNAEREQVTVGEYPGILVSGAEASELSPGMLLAEAGKYESYEAALGQMQ